MNRRELLISLTAAGNLVTAKVTARRPNVVVILADDMGYGDPSCYGGELATPNIDRLAHEGIRFQQGYVASPVCSPSRVGITTGQCPARHLIFSYLDSRKRQRELGMKDYLDPKVPTLARTLKSAGYATGHFGKWHMGGGRDVDDAPLPAAYGFDESITSFEGVGDRVLPPGKLSEASERLGHGRISHAPKDQLTQIYVDHALDFVGRNREKPLFVELWPRGYIGRQPV
jgi:arylsulfatase A-like enzyme